LATSDQPRRLVQIRIMALQAEPGNQSGFSGQAVADLRFVGGLGCGLDDGEKVVPAFGHCWTREDR
jgi:hypothetical protein